MNDRGRQVELPAFVDAIKALDADADGELARDEIQERRVKGYFKFLDLDHSGAMNAAEWRLCRAAFASVNAAMAIRVGGRGDMTESAVRWRYYRSIPQLPSPLVLDDRSIDDRRLYGVGVMRPESSPVEPRSASDIAAELRVRCVSGGGTARAPGVCGSGIAQRVELAPRVARNFATAATAAGRAATKSTPSAWKETRPRLAVAILLARRPPHLLTLSAAASRK